MAPRGAVRVGGLLRGLPATGQLHPLCAAEEVRAQGVQRRPWRECSVDTSPVPRGRRQIQTHSFSAPIREANKAPPEEVLSVLCVKPQGGGDRASHACVSMGARWDCPTSVTESTAPQSLMGSSGSISEPQTGTGWEGMGRAGTGRPAWGGPAHHRHFLQGDTQPRQGGCLSSPGPRVAKSQMKDLQISGARRATGSHRSSGVTSTPGPDAEWSSAPGGPTCRALPSRAAESWREAHPVSSSHQHQPGGTCGMCRDVPGRSPAGAGVRPDLPASRVATATKAHGGLSRPGTVGRQRQQRGAKRPPPAPPARVPRGSCLRGTRCALALRLASPSPRGAHGGL